MSLGRTVDTSIFICGVVGVRKELFCITLAFKSDYCEDYSQDPYLRARLAQVPEGPYRHIGNCRRNNPCWFMGTV